ncbi:uncharacterized protein LOC144180007 [Haemaphysalis longicornis]
MDRNLTTRTVLKIWHWNANGFRCRKAALQQHMTSAGQLPDVIMIQETHMEDTPSLPGYRAYSSPPSARECGKGAAQGVCTFVRKGLTSIHHENFLGRSSIEYCVTEIVVGRRKQEAMLLVNVYSNPTHGQQKFKALLHKTVKTKPNDTTVVCGDFNAPHKELGYSRTSVKGRELLEEASNAGFVLFTDPDTPTRIGASTTRDTNPDLTFARLSGKLDHKIDDIEAWTGRIASAANSVTAELDVEENVKQVDSKLAHMIEARQSLQRRWKRQRHNRRLRNGSPSWAAPSKSTAEQWYATCSAADGQLHKGQTWKLLRHLLDDKSTRGPQQHKLAQTIYTAVKELGEEEARETHTEHSGPDNPELDREIEEWEVRAVLQELNCKSAAGPDRLHNRALRNLNDGAIAALTRYFNKCWREGKLPKQWKTARTVLIPKPGKPPNIENLRPISLTSCVGKVMEHVMRNRWNRYLEEKGLYPDAMIGFREKLSTQDAMIQLQHEILDVSVPANDNGANLGLDLQSAFDKVRHSAILSQASRLRLGRRSYNYIRDFLSNRTRLNAQVRYTIYVDEITLWVPGGSDGHIEETLQEAVNAIEDQLDGTGLRCSP